jgi:hypothetical protein
MHFPGGVDEFVYPGLGLLAEDESDLRPPFGSSAASTRRDLCADGMTVFRGRGNSERASGTRHEIDLPARRSCRQSESEGVAVRAAGPEHRTGWVRAAMTTGFIYHDNGRRIAWVENDRDVFSVATEKKIATMQDGQLHSLQGQPLRLRLQDGGLVPTKEGGSDALGQFLKLCGA